MPLVLINNNIYMSKTILIKLNEAVPATHEDILVESSHGLTKTLHSFYPGKTVEVLEEAWEELKDIKEEFSTRSHNYRDRLNTLRLHNTPYESKEVGSGCVSCGSSGSKTTFSFNKYLRVDG